MRGKSNKGDNVTSSLLLAMRTGKYIVGFKRAIKSVIMKKAKCLVISSNFPSTKRKLLEYYSVLAGGLPIIFHSANNEELGSITERGHRLGCISIIDQGEAELIPAKGE
ncbi:60S RIBOSOMAL PROTEIN L30 [Encephalitozoon cuniculi GB-M1]|uniref:60S RIBOSOMAL PROTEIN L30 n=2 Tax=Encephalitozoon cuniculi TaxID=6035 RepID=Q8SRU1_ENCCU|nr:ribosomal 60S subunit protein L30 [Encephalitozoon cuniculi GB-M1]7QEP_O0 Chain O0, 60S RIBOSOMAL PROTEIN L30 [Encephalitozoon cuniculi GB-M1]AGE95492.1 60S ribosomal protein l30 [Encephalitozoon cuniculi]KMV66206.1 ribosomal protein L30E [Encephalitozoon cuniculi EcunIII-L]UYI27946.1 ribosomal protein L30 [Encephalitozoon cuniculi]CAD26669.1 60S RIBOSOMAL PROTEIN L30 [Encephalitozoon cuniculi GB-M1]